MLRWDGWVVTLGLVAVMACGPDPSPSRSLPAVPPETASPAMPWAGQPGPEYRAAALPDRDGASLALLAPDDRPWARYLGELLRTEGFTTFDVVGSATADALGAAHVLLVGAGAATDADADALGALVTRGTDLLLVRPTGRLAELAGLEVLGEQAGGVLTRPGRAPLQVLGTAIRYRPTDATALAALHAGLEPESVGPAVTVRRIEGGGRVVALGFDPAQTVVQLRQGNPDWADVSRDGFRRFRSTDLFFGGADRPPGAGTEREPDHVLWPLAAAPQADEHLRLLRELLVAEDAAAPLPRVDYLPFGRRAAVLMTGDDHGSGGTAGRFARFEALSDEGCRPERWECVRGSSYVDPSIRLDPDEVARWTELGFEIGLHVAFDDPLDGATYAELAAAQQAALDEALPGLPPATSRRNHGAAMSGYAIQPKVLSQGPVRLDVNGYFWPPSWVADRPPYPGGTLLPMRFADRDGSPIDAFGLPTVWTDESGQHFPAVAASMLDGARARDGWPGVFVSNFHTDAAESREAEVVIAAARERGLAVISGRQLMSWWEAREAVEIRVVAWDGSRLEFEVLPHEAAGARIELPWWHEGRSALPARDGVRLRELEVHVERGREILTLEASPGRYVVAWGASGGTRQGPPATCTPWNRLPTTQLELRGLRRGPDGELRPEAAGLGHPDAAAALTGGAFGRGGASRASGGAWILDHAWLAEPTPVEAPATLRARVTFGSAPYQSVGFAASLTAEPMAIVTTGADGSLRAFARSADGTTFERPLPVVPGQEALVEIDWRADGVTWSVDGAVAAEHGAPPSGPLYRIASDFQLGAALLRVVTLDASEDAVPGATVVSGPMPRSDVVGWFGDYDGITVEIEDADAPGVWKARAAPGPVDVGGPWMRVRATVQGAREVRFAGRCGE